MHSHGEDEADAGGFFRIVELGPVLSKVKYTVTEAVISHRSIVVSLFYRDVGPFGSGACGMIYAFDLETPNRWYDITYPQTDRRFTALSFDPCGDTLVAVSDIAPVVRGASFVNVYDFASTRNHRLVQALRAGRAGPSRRYSSTAVSSTHIAASDYARNLVDVWERGTWACVRSLQVPSDGPCISILCLRGNRLVYGGRGVVGERAS